MTARWQRIQAYAEALEQCTFCHDQCVFACPVVDVSRRTTHYPSRLLQLVWLISRGQVAADEESVRALYQCIGCGRCATWCVYTESPSDVAGCLRAARADAVAVGVRIPEVAQFEARVRRDGTPWGPLSRLYSAVPEPPCRLEESEALFYIGPALLALAPEGAAALYRILSRLTGVTWARPEPYIGLELAEAGLDTLAAEAYAAALDFLRGSGARRIVFASPRDRLGLAAPGRRWQELEATLTTGAAYFAEALERGILTVRPDAARDDRPRRVAFHDDWAGARGLGELDAARVLLRALFRERLVELHDHGANAYPAGAEGPAIGIDPGTGRAMALARLEQAREAGVELIVTVDPYAFAALRQAAASGGGGAVRVLTLWEALDAHCDVHR